MIIGLAILVIAFFSIRSCINQVPAIFAISDRNRVCRDGTVLKRILLKASNLKRQVHLLTVSPSDGVQLCHQMKQMAMLATAEIDFVLMDQAT